MNTVAIEFIKSLEKFDSADSLLPVLDELILVADFDSIFEICTFIESPAASFLADETRGRVLWHVNRTLCLSDQPGASRLILKLAGTPQLYTYEPPADDWNMWHRAYTASWLSLGQTRASLIDLFSTQADQPHQRDLLACLAQEMLIRKVPFIENELSEFYRAVNADSSMPLSWLPWGLAPCEQQLGLYLPSWTGNVWSMYFPFVPNLAKESFPQAELESSFRIEIERELSPQSYTTTAVDDWAIYSAGRLENRRFHLRPRNKPKTFTHEDILCVGLNCLAQAAADSLILCSAQLSDILNVLFVASANGGANTLGHYAAYGRLEAWQSISGLIGESKNCPFDNLLSKNSGWNWYLFHAQSPWFNALPWAFGIAALNPDSGILSVLAAADDG